MKIPAYLQKSIREKGGLNPHGFPNFRIIWGGDRFTWIGGRWNHHDDSGNVTGSHIGLERVLKHPESRDRWILEVWCPAENYGSEAVWEAMFTEWIDGVRVETMGPFPREGEYEIVKVIEREYRDTKGIVWKKEFVPLTPTICDAIVDTAIRNKDLPERIKKEAKRAMFAQQEKEKDQRLEEKFEKIENKAEWEKNTHVAVPTEFEISKFS